MCGHNSEQITFFHTTGNISSVVVNQVIDYRHKQVLENRRRLVLIVKTILRCSRLGISLRGHRDDGKLDQEAALSSQEGNFRAMLAFRVDSGDLSLKHQLETGNRNATYISKDTQIHLIEE